MITKIVGLCHRNYVTDDGFSNCHKGVGTVQIELSKDSEVPLRTQLADQIVFLIRTGQLQAGVELPSVRAFGRQIGVHHNTVSEAYQDLVGRGFLTRRRGSRLMVGAGPIASSVGRNGLDELINESIERARDMGYTLQALRLRVRERLLAQPPDHVLVVEQEPGLRDIITAEVHESSGWLAQGCSYDDFTAEPGLAIGAQVLVAKHLMESVKPHVPATRPAIGIVYSQAAEELNLLRKLHKPSIVAVVSVSELLLKTARSLLAPEIGRRHTLNLHLVVPGAPIDPGAADVVICDTVTMGKVRSRHTVRYRLVAADCLEHIATALTQF
jgi:GntR family transcriptional regulator